MKGMCVLDVIGPLKCLLNITLKGVDYLMYSCLLTSNTNTRCVMFSKACLKWKVIFDTAIEYQTYSIRTGSDKIYYSIPPILYCYRINRVIRYRITLQYRGICCLAYHLTSNSANQPLTSHIGCIWLCILVETGGGFTAAFWVRGNRYRIKQLFNINLTDIGFIRSRRMISDSATPRRISPTSTE